MTHQLTFPPNQPFLVRLILVGISLATTFSYLKSSGASGDDDRASREAIVATLKQNCFDCHANGASEGDLKLDELLDQPASEFTRQRWWKVISNVRAGTMPPPDSGFKLNADDKLTLGNWIKYDAMGIDRLNPDPGQVTVRRLNRREYSNTIRDLMGVDFNADIVFPPDDTGFGFDNIGDALSLSPMLVEKYVEAASEIVDQSVPKATWVMPRQRLHSPEFRSADGGNGDNMRMNKPKRVERTFDVPAAGDYKLEVDLKTHGSFEFSPQRCQIICKLDGEQLFEGEYAWDESKHHRYTFSRSWTELKHHLEFELIPIALDTSIKITDGMFAEIDVDWVDVIGPSDQAHWQHPPGYSRYFPLDLPPGSETERRDYARSILNAFATRAYRRPPTQQVVDRLVHIAESIYSEPNTTFEAGIAQAITSILASPRFLFRLEGNVQTSSSDPFPMIDEYALASRLSYFLWSTMPDEELFELAKTNRLRDQLDIQLERMLNDKRSNALVQNFVGQWLRTRDVEKVSIDALAVFGVQKEFDDALAEFRKRRFRPPSSTDPPLDAEAEAKRKRFRDLAALRDTLDGDVRQAMRRETEMLFEFIAIENRSLIEIIDPGYTFVNEKLAKHYGLSDIKGSEMRRVELPPSSPRGGVLTQGSMLTVTSNPTRTSPVKRGLFILENILGTPTPPAPPNVPALEDAAGRFGGREPSLRELLAVHRESALCSSCHSRMDPLGLALENFNALGMWRDTEKGLPIDAEGQLITGEKFSNIQDLRRIIANERSEDFYRCISQKMMTYALGRGLEYYDEHTMDQLVYDLRDNQGKYRTLIQGIVHSAPFQRLRPKADNQPSLAKDPR